MSADSQTPLVAIPKYTRYRSVRQASANQGNPSPTPDETKDAQPGALQKSRSRYRRPRAASSPLEPGASSQVPPTPRLPQNYSTSLSPGVEHDPAVRNVSPEQRTRRPATATDDGRRQRLEERESYSTLEQTSSDQLNEKRLRRQQEFLRQQQQEYEQERRQRTEEEENAKRLEEQKRKDLERLEAELAAAAARPMSPGKSSPARDTSGVEKLFGLRRSVSKKQPPKPSSIKVGSDTITTAQSNELRKVKSDESPRAIVRGGGGIVPGIDAPISAVNAGERRVLVRCRQSSINLPVTPETTSVDLVYSAANILSQAITPSAAILLESYIPLGLERRIRRYEHIRDIMNSWDRDTQNSLIIQASDSPNHDKDLEAFAVLKEQPADVTVYLYHSQKPGKWSKRYITLLSTGQIFLSKKAGSKVSDKDIVTICHLTDFDIYAPTPQQLRKSIKPPKKYCHAVKSQQRTAMFLNTDNFVHFFSTDDPVLADKWYDAVQQWRSWYLVRMVGEGKKKTPASKSQTVPEMRARSGSTSVQAHKVKVSVDESPYTIGSFKPFLDLRRFENLSPDNEEDREEDEDRPRQIPFHLRNAQSPQLRREHHPPPVSLTRRNLPASGNEPITLLSPGDTFSPTGLLGQTYSDRQRAQKEREVLSQSNDGPFVPGPSLLNNAASLESARPRTGVDSSQERVFGRSMSMKNKRPETSAGPHYGGPKPLIDLSPKIAEAQQWSRHGKGHGVAPPAGVPLVEAATSLDSALDPLARMRRKDAGA